MEIYGADICICETDLNSQALKLFSVPPTYKSSKSEFHRGKTYCKGLTFALL